MRVVSLTCSNTEIMHFLGASDLLVGVDDHSDYPVEPLRGVSRVGPDLQIDIDAVAALRPDLVLASLTVPGHEKVVDALKVAGLPFMAPSPQSLAEIGRDIVDIGTAIGSPEAGLELSDEFARRLAPGASQRHEDLTSILVQWWPKPVIAPGRRSWVADLLELVGARTALDEDVESRPLEDCEVATIDPEAIVVSWCGVEANKVRPDVIRSNPAFAKIRAVRSGHIACIPEAWLGRPSPRLAWGRWALGEVASAARNGQPVPSALATAAASAALLSASAPWPPDEASASS